MAPPAGCRQTGPLIVRDAAAVAAAAAAAEERGRTAAARSLQQATQLLPAQVGLALLPTSPLLL